MSVKEGLFTTAALKTAFYENITGENENGKTEIKHLPGLRRNAEKLRNVLQMRVLRYRIPQGRVDVAGGGGRVFPQTERF